MREIKYTSDGRKVVIIGSLNSQETIVQEIFVVEGQEVPSGENFVVKSLHDAPAISWKEKRIAEIDKAFIDRERSDERAKESLRVIQREMKDRISYLRSVVKNLKPEVFDGLELWLGGEVRFVVHLRYSTVQILTTEDFSLSNVDRYDTGLRLLSLFGRDDGTLSYHLNQYSDGSGSWTEIYPFRTFEEAKEKATELIRGITSYSAELVKFATDNNIPLDANKLQTFNDARWSQAEKAVQSAKESLERANVNLASLREAK